MINVFTDRYAAFLKHGTGQAFQCLGWLCPATFIVCISRHQYWHFVSLRPETRDVAACVSGVSSMHGTWYSERVILQFMCVGCWAGVTYLRYAVLTSPNQDETAVHCCDPALSVLVMLVSRNVFHVVSALQSVISDRKARYKSAERYRDRVSRFLRR